MPLPQIKDSPNDPTKCIPFREDGSFVCSFWSRHEGLPKPLDKDYLYRDILTFTGFTGTGYSTLAKFYSERLKEEVYMRLSDFEVLIVQEFVANPIEANWSFRKMGNYITFVFRGG
jgi:hypothetical protein